MHSPSEQLTGLLRTALRRGGPIVFLGVGNPLRGDDAVGHLLADSLARLNGSCFQAYAVGTALENAGHCVRRAAGGILVVADAVFDEALPEGEWAMVPVDRLDSVCHTTHSIPISLLLSLWKNEVSDLDVHFIGISIRTNAELAPLSARLQETWHDLRRVIAAAIA